MVVTFNYSGNDYDPGESFVATSTSFSGNVKARVIADMPKNNFNPIYEFNTSDLVSDIDE